MERNGHNRRHPSGPRLLARVDKMLATGRITDENATRLRAAAETGDFDSEAEQIRFRHVKARVDTAVDDGRLTKEEADAALGCVANGEHPRLPRGLRRG